MKGETSCKGAAADSPKFFWPISQILWSSLTWTWWRDHTRRTSQNHPPTRDQHQACKPPIVPPISKLVNISIQQLVLQLTLWRTFQCKFWPPHLHGHTSSIYCQRHGGVQHCQMGPATRLSWHICKWWLRASFHRTLEIRCVCIIPDSRGQEELD